MSNKDLEALAAEYVLGTLAPDGRIDAEKLIATDSGFGEIVRRWERRLGELNVAGEAVEPNAALACGDAVGAAVAAAPVPAAAAALEKADDKPGATEDVKAEEPKSAAATGQAMQDAPPPTAVSLQGGGGAQTEPDATPAPALQPQPHTSESTQLQSLARRLRRWRLAAAASSLAAVALAALLAFGAASDRMARRALAPQPARSTPPVPVTRLVAVLQQEPSSPAFLLTVDPAARTLTVRRVAARAQAGHSYELWEQVAHAKPRTLGLVGDTAYTQRPLPPDLDVEAMRKARYEISFEPAGGSKSGAPSGPILFTGTLVDAAQPPPPAPKS